VQGVHFRPCTSFRGGKQLHPGKIRLNDLEAAAAQERYRAGCVFLCRHRKIDLDSDPPPDVAVEIDTTNESRAKFSIYAALGIPEIWRYDGRQVEIYNLKGGSYVRTNASDFLVDLSASC